MTKPDSIFVEVVTVPEDAPDFGPYRWRKWSVKPFDGSTEYRRVDPVAASPAPDQGGMEGLKAEDEWEYRTVEGPRKGGEPFTLENEGWERDYSQGREGEAWDRFDYHEEYYWKRRATLESKP